MTPTPDLERAREAERIARRLTREHPDPKARRVYHLIAARVSCGACEANREGSR